MRFVSQKDEKLDPRYGIVIGLKVSKKAVLRNRKKRQIREIIKNNYNKIRSGVSFIIIAKPDILRVDYREMENYYYGNKEQFEKRHLEAKKWIEGLREASQTSNHLFQLDNRINQLESQLEGITVHDEDAELKAENTLLKSTLRELKKHTTGTGALKVALARVKELEDKRCDCKQKARECIEVVDYYNEHAPTYDELIECIKESIKGKFNLGE